MTLRIAALDKEACMPRKCQTECINFCPVNRMDSECIVLGDEGKALISEELCTGCGICIKKCPFDAITIVNLAEELGTDKIHQYGVNEFRLYRLPTLRKGAVAGLVGRNGVGKSTAINILAGNLKPNLGDWDSQPDWDQVIDTFQTPEVREHFQKIAGNELRVSIKPQAVYQIPQVWKGDGLSMLKKVDERGNSEDLISHLNLEGSIRKKLSDLSGGELQRLAVAAAACKDADFYFFDEPSSYNDVYQRLSVTNVITELAGEGKFVLLVEHDLTLLDYVSDTAQILFGEPGAYGIVSSPMSSRVGLNVLLDGYLPRENIRFRDQPVKFEIYAPLDQDTETPSIAKYPSLLKRYKEFTLQITGGELLQGQVMGILGANALGKTTFLKMLAGVEKPSKGEVEIKAKISYKPQYLSSDYEGDVRSLLSDASGGDLESGLVQSQVVAPLSLNKLFDKNVASLSGGELQKVAVSACLLSDADIYFLDEPSAFIDVEDRITLAKVIQKFVRSRGRSAMIVDHDVQLIDIVSDSLMIFSGIPSVKGSASNPLPKNSGMDIFLKELGVTYRRDIDTGRPRVNKPGSKLDKKQKEVGRYYYLDKVELEE
ncbi:MAG: ribosome biogenesis/translation initiation ATPase RLI [Nitrososphaerales archaeon]